MLLIPQILVRTLALGASAVALAACGQQGPLYLPDTGGAHRATLPESLLPRPGTPSTTPQPASTASTPKNL
ncbi:MAG: lipoprotein [Rhodoferax sp.]|uniref:LPS translocon maturation chaperone LptM n=1 Tax=Rhodoferax sp. TaxID=50421 RepID=UPI00261B3937|nr:lipoprotein [Rhodoferax sp.]MDD2879501.1 lipoprotein [Rhodoferax sp.]